MVASHPAQSAGSNAAQATPESPTPAMLDLLTARAAQLYSLPAVASQVLQLTGGGDVDKPALKACLENDPALTTRILKVVNSSLFGVTRKVTDLGQALGLLGVKPLKMLVLGFSLPTQLVNQADEAFTQYWRRALLKAAGCREICRRLFAGRAEEAFTAGLLQDIGELVLIQQLGAAYSRFRGQVRKEQRPLREAQRLALGFDHLDLSARLLGQWGMPPSFLAIVAGKKSEEEPSVDQVLVKVLIIADLMASVIEAGSDQVDLSGAAQAELGLSEDQLQEILDGLIQRTEELVRILSIDLPPRTELSVAAHARLSEETAQMLEGAGDQVLLSDMGELWNQLQAAVRRQTSLPQKAKVAPPTLPTRAKPQTASLAADEQLVGEVMAAIGRCRGEKRSLSLVLFQAHGVLARGGVPSPYPAPQRLLGALEQWSQDRGNGLAIPPSYFALLWEGYTRNESFELARHVLRQAQECSLGYTGLAPGWMLSAGLATLALPSRNFPPQDLIAAAERCLAGALLSGGSVKSIEF
jgi:HD-like signal output (HDOD) protein